MYRRSRPLVMFVAGLLAVACSTSPVDDARTAATDTRPATTSGPGTSPTDDVVPCSAEPVRVVVSVDQWAEVVRARGGACVEVTAVIAGTAVDPHDYEPTAADTAAITNAGLVVLNGADYDHWAADAAAAAGADVRVLDIADLLGIAEGRNPHLWYDPEAIDRVADAVTDLLRELRPGAADYLDGRVEVADAGFAPYRAAVESATATAGGRRYAATETVFDLMAAHLGMVNATPPGFLASTLGHDAEPSPRDLAAFERILQNRDVDVLIMNVQSTGPVAEQLRGVATSAGIPVVEVTETLPPGTTSFVEWQVAQLQALEQALAR